MGKKIFCPSVNSNNHITNKTPLDLNSRSGRSKFKNRFSGLSSRCWLVLRHQLSGLGLLELSATNTVSSLKTHPFSRLTQQEKLEVKHLGPDRPELVRSQSSASLRKFSTSWYTKYEWLTVGNQTQKVYSFPCLLFGESQREKMWTDKGFF